jgi:DNA-binding beta-propeller fold protein YncE
MPHRDVTRGLLGANGRDQGVGPRCAAIAVSLAIGAFTAAPAVAAAPDASASGAVAAKKTVTKKQAKTKKRGKTREVIFVGNNWEGTADVIRLLPGPKPGKPKATARDAKKRLGPRLRRVARLNIIPDIEERMLEIFTDPVRLGYYLGIRQLVGEGNDQYVDDMYSSNDGRLLIVSRPSLADVVALNIATGEIVWRFVVDGQRSDHMAISPDGRHLAVSASTGNVVHILDVETGEEVGRFESGDSPHENSYSRDGSRIFHASIGLVYTPADQPVVDTSKGERYFQVVDARTNEILKRIDMGQKLEEAGYPDMSAAVRPMAIHPKERFVYLQVSFFHGFVEYDLKTDRVRRVAHLPNFVPDMPREQYLLDSAHHGIAINGKGKRLCIAGTMSDYAAIVTRKRFGHKRTLIQAGTKPYWATTTTDGRHCLVSWSGTDSMSVISYAKRKEVARIKVGDHPQRVRMGRVRVGWLRSN